MNRVVAPALVLAAALFLPEQARSEVMDKEPTIAAFWMTALIGGVAGALLWRLSRWTGLISTIVPMMLFAETHSELRDPFAGPAILQEAGPSYELNFWLALGTLIVLQGAGALWWGWSRAKRSKATVEQADEPAGPAAGTS